MSQTIFPKPPPAHPLIRSDDLRNLREFVAAHPLLAGLIQIVQVRLVIDANSVIRDVLWMARRRKASGRTDLLEAIDAGTVVPYVPPGLDAEVLERLPALAEEEEVPVERLRAEWEAIRARLRYHAPAEGPRPAMVPDEDDLPYLYLSLELGTAIFTADSHLRIMSGQVVGIDVITALRDYSRSAAVGLTIKTYGSIGVATVGTLSVQGLISAAKALAGLLGRLPQGAKLLLVAILLGFLLHPKGRAFLLSMARLLPDTIRRAVDVLTPLAERALVSTARVQAELAAATTRIQPVLPARMEPARVHALRVCAEAGHPLSIVEIELGMRRAGYVSTAKSHRAYLRRVLRSHPRLREIRKDEWEIAPADAPA